VADVIGQLSKPPFDTLEIETIVLCNFTDLEELIVFNGICGCFIFF